MGRRARGGRCGRRRQGRRLNPALLRRVRRSDDHDHREHRDHQHRRQDLLAHPIGERDRQSLALPLDRPGAGRRLLARWRWLRRRDGGLLRVRLLPVTAGRQHPAHRLEIRATDAEVLIGRGATAPRAHAGVGIDRRWWGWRRARRASGVAHRRNSSTGVNSASRPPVSFAYQRLRRQRCTRRLSTCSQ